MTEQRCLNCDAVNSATARFCAHCGQRSDTARLTFADMARDLMHTFMNIERGPAIFAWALLTRPGHIARDYVEGRRRRYYGPFATLAVLVGITTLAIQLSGFQVLSQELPGPPAHLLTRYFNLVLLIQLPLLGFACALVFRDTRLTLPEHMVLVAYALCVRAVALTAALPFAFLSSGSAPTYWQTMLFWGAWYLYFGWVASQFYRGTRWSSWLRGILVAAIGHGLIMAALAAGIAALDFMPAD